MTNNKNKILILLVRHHFSNFIKKSSVRCLLLIADLLISLIQYGKKKRGQKGNIVFLLTKHFYCITSYFFYLLLCQY